MESWRPIIEITIYFHVFFLLNMILHSWDKAWLEMGYFKRKGRQSTDRKNRLGERLDVSLLN
jgi:hypothetical protein